MNFDLVFTIDYRDSSFLTDSRVYTNRSMVEIASQLFNSYAEIHVFQLGALLGLFVAFTYYRHPFVAYALLFFGVFLAFGNAAHIGWGGISRKPWYFLSATFFTTVGGLLILRIYGRIRAPPDTDASALPHAK